MSTPIAVPADLGVYLGDAAIDPVRATLILAMAQALCETVVSPLPDTAMPIVLGVAARAYNNVTSAHSVGIGSASIAYGADRSSVGIGGMYLSRSDKQVLRRLAGRGGAFSVSTLPVGTNAVLSVTVAATAGTFTLSFAGAVTAPIPFNASPAAVQVALEALGVLGAGTVTVTGAYVVTFGGTMSTCPVPPLVANGANLTGSVVTGIVIPGVLAPGQGLPPWDYDYYRNLHVLGQQVYGGQW